MPVRNISGLLIALALAACGGASVTSPSATVARPTGIYALGSDPDPAIISQPFVDGSVFRLNWNAIETAQGLYDFSKIDAAIAALEPYGKKLTLVIFALVVPTYILDQPGVSTYDAVAPSGALTTTAVPWDAFALSRWDAFCLALSGHLVPDSQSGSMVALRDHPVLAQVHSPIVGLEGVRDVGGKLVAAPGYERTAFKNAALGSIHSMVDRFPNKFRYLAFFDMVDGTLSPPLGQYLLDSFMTEFNAGATPKLGFFQENLACDTPGEPLVFSISTTKDSAFSMFQMLQSWIDPSLNPARTDPCLVTTTPLDRTTAVSGPEVAIGYAYNTFGTRYFEIYPADLAHPGFADEFTTWHATLFSTP